jgi:4-amino-4-deoxy-L-arabinose transferase-like glycosyltransferase
VLLCAAILLAPLPLELRFAAGFGLTVLLPGHLVVAGALAGRRLEPLEHWLLAAGCGYVLAMLLMFGVASLARPIFTPDIVLGGAALNGALLLLARWRRTDLRPPLARPGWPLLLVLAVAAPLRLVDLQFSDFQSDEARVALRALALVQGWPDALSAHGKPSGEILLGALYAAELGSLNEAAGRLPFALAGVGAVLASYSLGRAAFGERVALLAALLLAVNGYFVALGRMLQYPSVSFLLDTLVVLCLYRWASEPDRQRGFAMLGSMCALGSALLGFSVLFLLPVGLFAFRHRWGRGQAVNWRDLVVWLGPAAAIALPLTVAVLATGAPDLIDPTSTGDYVEQRVGGTRLYFNLERFQAATSLYTSSLYLLVVWTAGALFLAWRTRHGQMALGGWLALIWLLGPLVAHLFVVRYPLTHWRELFPGLVLLSAGGLLVLYDWIRPRPGRLLAGLVFGGFLAACGQYVYVVWLQPWPEYRLLYPAARHPLDWYGDDARRYSVFLGAAHRHGWKTAGLLVQRGELPLPIATNETTYQSAWYLRTARVCEQRAQSYARGPRTAADPATIEQGAAPPGWQLVSQVRVDDRPTLSLMRRASGPIEVKRYDEADFAPLFDRQLGSAWSPVGQLYQAGLAREAAC